MSILLQKIFGKHPLLAAVLAVVLLAAIVTVFTLAGFDMGWLGLDLPWAD